jgi:hypothetical protein
MEYELNLRVVNPMFHDEARKAFRAGKASSFVHCAENHVCLALVADNWIALRDRSIFEECLLKAFVATRANHSEWPISAIEFLFSLAKRERLRELSDPLPSGDTFKVYRGVAGVRNRRKVTGYSWTMDLPSACWFASRFGLDDPAVYVATIKRRSILAFHNSRHEQEVICRPRTVKRLVISAEEIAAHQATVAAAQHKDSQSQVAELIAKRKK